MKRVILTALACLAVPASAAPSNSIPPWKSYKETDNPADIVSSPTVAAAIGTKVDAVNGQASGLQVQGGELTSTDLNAAVATAQGGTSAQALAAKLHEVLSIRDFGAKCDGATDDATAINAALSAASSSGTPSVLVPPSVTACMVGSTLIVPAGTAFYSALNAATIKATSSLSGPLVQFASAAQDMRIYGLILDGGGVDGSNTSPVVQGYQTTNAVVDSVTVQNAPRQAVLFSQSNRSGVVGSTIRNIGNHWKTTLSMSDAYAGIVVCCTAAGYGQDNFIQNNHISDVGLDGASVTENARTIISGNVFDMTNQQHTLIPNASAYAAGIYAANGASIIGSANTIAGASGSGIDTYQAKSAALYGNYVSGSGFAGILVAGDLEAVLTGNILADNVQAGSGNSNPFLGGISLCSNIGSLIVAGNYVGNINGTTQEYGVYAGTTANGSCTIPTASVARIGQDNDLSSNTQGAIGPNTAFGYYQPVTGQPVPSYTLASLPTSGTEGQRAYCMDCTLNSVAGVEVHWSASAAKWLSAGNIAASK